MQALLRILLLSGLMGSALAQNKINIDSFSEMQSPRVVDSLRRLLSVSREDSSRVLLLHELSYPVLFSSPDSAMYYAQEGLKLALSLDYKKGEALCKTDVGAVWWITGEYSKANEVLLASFEDANAIHDPRAQDWALSFLITIYRDQGNYDEALKFMPKSTQNRYFSRRVWNTIRASVFLEMNILDSALFYLNQGDMGAYNFLLLGHAHAKMENKILAARFYKKSISKLLIEKNFKDLANAYVGLAKLHENENNLDSSIYYAHKGFSIAKNASFKKWVYETGLILSRIYEKRDAVEALNYLKLAMAAKDSMFNLQNITRSLNARFNDQLSQQLAQSEKISYRNKIRTYVLLVALGFFSVLAIVLWQNNRQKQKAKTEIELAYKGLKSTQAQLIQSEKMASLGELTAGIAHEIQNPLNFVNNFSEVNKELLSEMKEEIEKGNLEEAKSIAANVIDNHEKINQHGKRADAIVKGMLQHSRSSSGIKEQTNINTLADEYLKLAYHGFRTKEKNFNVKLETDFDEGVGTLNVIPQDIGRVILNLLNNAFYAVSAKAPIHFGTTADGNYEPTVSVSTKKSGNTVLISIKDNGIGIPLNILDKIFQPFFTTKPTGRGTGLGLSLSYDIMKAHGGELRVITIEGQGSEFIIQIPAA